MQSRPTGSRSPGSGDCLGLRRLGELSFKKQRSKQSPMTSARRGLGGGLLGGLLMGGLLGSLFMGGPFVGLNL